MQEKHDQYYEGILQLRDSTKELEGYIESKVSQDNKARITAKKKVKMGYDYYLTSNKYLRYLGKELQNKFKGELKQSCELYSRDRQTSKALYRYCILFRPSKFKKGQIISYKGEQIIILFCDKKKIVAKNIKSGVKAHIRYNDL